MSHLDRLTDTRVDLPNLAGLTPRQRARVFDMFRTAPCGRCGLRWEGHDLDIGEAMEVFALCRKGRPEGANPHYPP